MVELQRGGQVEARARSYHRLAAGMRLGEGRRKVEPAPAGPAAPTAVMVTVSWFAGVPTVILSPTAKPFTPRTLILVAPALASAESAVRLACVPTLVTVTVSIPWPTLSMSNRILSPTEMLATDVTLMLVAPAGASAAR